MRLNDYKMSSEYDKEKWLESYKIITGLPYFGGKAYIGKYLINRICNMAVQMDIDGKKPDIFIDVFGGGGKIALSIPEGWFDTIVLNDYNYGITSFFNCCKDSPDELIELIEKLGSVMNKDLFHILAFIRSNDGQKSLEKEYKNESTNNDEYESNEDKEEKATRYKRYKEVLFEDEIEPLLSAAATYWVTKLDFMGITDPLRVSYNASIKDNKSETIGNQNEKEKIANIVKGARKHILDISQRMRKNNIIVERLDFAELVKKYNGKPYEKTNHERCNPETAYTEKNILWYMDSPYHPSTLSKGEKAPYEDTFDIELVSKMTEIIHNDKEAEYGKIEYFIKSDYDPKETLRFALEMIERYTAEKEKLGLQLKSTQDKRQDINDGDKDWKTKRLKIINDYLEKMEEQKTLILNKDKQKFLGKDIAPFHHFDCLEDNSEYVKDRNKEKPEYFKECLGEFTKGAINKITGEKVIGKEYIWFKGMKSSYVEKAEENIIELLKK